MPIDNLVGVMVEDAQTYERYRVALAPVLTAHGAQLIVDLQVDELLTAPPGKGFNRLFLMRFPSAQAAQKFSKNPDYLRLRAELFEPSISATVFLGRYEVPPNT